MKTPPSKKQPAPATHREPSSASVKYSDIRQDLERQRAAILNETGEVLTHRENPEAFPDVSDQASAEVDQGFSMRIRDRERKLLKKIDEALERMTTETYGICEGCGGEIPYKRLKARPVTTFCIECKTLQEQEEQARS
ncbi:MAG: RNA polymerase-binding protein DksA [Nitrospira sp.]|jgi:DnaK suppressor protein|uniref:RNA polymerase-binding protein DksA n=1 Tax=Nitrospira cf. moscoviensis SBR1015 TaxID=96242 RepID=UPI000A3BB688|nr:RNA polymerase-binding protein DksA [Nitrospira cf. moscoviensis SBR1015]MBH0208791.1 RNA polymerase-binding protein DksA [Nitrospira sp.]